MGKAGSAGMELCCTQCYGIAAWFPEYAADVGHRLLVAAALLRGREAPALHRGAALGVRRVEEPLCGSPIHHLMLAGQCVGT